MEIGKIVFIIAFGVFSFSLIACYHDDDDLRRVQVELENAVTFQEKETYKIGDTLYFGVGFSRYIEEKGYSDLLDVYATSGQTKYNYNFRLNKFSAQSGGYNAISIDFSNILFNGRVWGSDYYDFFTQLNDGEQEYSSQIGIVLKEEGDYVIEVSGLYGNEYNPDKVDLYLHFFEEKEFEVVD